MIRSLFCAASTLLLLISCGKKIDTKEAIQQAIVQHLSKRTDLTISTMHIEVNSVTFRGNEAEALVSFAPKGAPGGGMQMRYTLEKKGSEWAVKSKADSGQAGHGAAGAEPGLPPAHPPIPPARSPGTK